jgi:2,4-dienoyl-CoA reductase-like NADH-dependent reductase (Old Yellow Enzyme family)
MIQNVNLFSTIALGTVTLKNRTVVAPMTRVSATEDGHVTDRIVAYYEEFARGGWGLVETEATYIDAEYSQCRRGQPGIATATHRNAWLRVVEAVHTHGAAIFMQLQHAGAFAEALRYCSETVAPSAVAPRSSKPLPMPRELTAVEIAGIKENFCRAAVRAVEAGFDGVELHGTNGYLIDQFLTDYTNLRTDQYGGSIANRIRFACETVSAVRRAVPAGFPVGIRLNPGKTNDPGYEWPGGEATACEIFRSIVAAGASFLHISGLNAPHPARATPMLSDLAKRVTSVAVIANGGLDEPARAEQLLTAGCADLVSLGRGALANPDWPRRVAANAPLAAYDPAMIRPVPTLENADAWRKQHARDASARHLSP